MVRKKLLIFSVLFFISTLILITPISRSAPSWNGPVRLTNHGGTDYINNQGGSLALDANKTIHVVSYYGNQLYYIYDNQGYINESVITTVNSLHPEYRASPVIGIDSTGVIHIVYYASDGADYEIYYIHSIAGGGFSSPLQLTNNEAPDDFPQMVIDSNDRLHIVYQTGLFVPVGNLTKVVITLNYIYSTGFEQFSAPTEIIKPSWADSALFQTLAVDSNRSLHIAYMAAETLLTTNYVIIYTNNTGGSFSSYDLINVTGEEFEPSIAVGPDDSAHIVFRGDIDRELYYVNNSLGSFNSSVPMNISTLPLVQAPRIMVDNNNTVNVILSGNNGTAEDPLSLYLISNSTGSFSNETILFEEEYDQYHPNPVLDSDGNIHIVYISGPVNNEDIYYLTTASYYPVGVGPPFDPTFIFIIIGVVAGGGAVAAIILLYRRFKRAEKELWEPKLDRDKPSEARKKT